MSVRAAMENPEPVEPTMVNTPDGLYCIDHGVMDCTLPFCWRCGNHLMDSFERCADPKCRASNGPEARMMVEAVKEDWNRYGPDGPAPLELIEFFIGLKLQDKLRRTIAAYCDNSSPSLQPGEPGGGGVPEPFVPATGAPE